MRDSKGTPPWYHQAGFKVNSIGLGKNNPFNPWRMDGRHRGYARAALLRDDPFSRRRLLIINIMFHPARIYRVKRHFAHFVRDHASNSKLANVFGRAAGSSPAGSSCGSVDRLAHYRSFSVGRALEMNRADIAFLSIRCQP